MICRSVRLTRIVFAGPQLDVPHDVTPSQLETLLNGLRQTEERLPYSFFIQEQELAAELGAHLLKHKAGPASCEPPCFGAGWPGSINCLCRCFSLSIHVHTLQVSVESVLRVVYHPQAVFKVRAVTRCTASIAGHAGAASCRCCASSLFLACAAPARRSWSRPSQLVCSYSTTTRNSAVPSMCQGGARGSLVCMPDRMHYLLRLCCRCRGGAIC